MWKNIEINIQNIEIDTGNAVLIKIPNKSKYASYKFWHPSKLVRYGSNSYARSIGYTDEFTFKLFKNGKHNKFEVIDENEIDVEEFEEALRAIKKAKPDVIPLTFFSKSTAGDQGTRAFVANIFGGSVMNDDQSSYNFDSPEAIKAMEWVKKAIDEGLIAKGSEALASNDSIDLYLQQKAAITILYSTGLVKSNQSKKSEAFDDILLPIPAPEGKLALESLIGGLCVFDNGNEAKIEASKKFIDFLCNDKDWQEKNLKATGTFSVRNSVKNLYDDEEMKFAEAMGAYTAKYYNTVNGFAEMRTHWFPALQEITLGQKSVEDAMKDFNKKANETLNKK